MAKPKRNILKSISTGVLIGAIFLATVLWLPFLFPFFITCVAVKAYMELKKAYPKINIIILSALTSALIIISYFFSAQSLLISFLLALIILLIVFWKNIPATIFTFIYISIPFIFANLILNNLGPSYIIFIALICSVSDIGGLVIGSKFGKHKLSPKISPNKTVEGFIGSIVFSAICISIYLRLFSNDDANMVVVTLAGILIATIATFGDLCESLLKRSVGLKDFGTILEGHGGVLDRFDVYLIVLPIFYTLLLI